MALRHARPVASSPICAALLALALGIAPRAARAWTPDRGTPSNLYQSDQTSSAPVGWRLLWTWPATGIGLSHGGSRDGSSVPVLGMTVTRELPGVSPGRLWIVEGEVGLLAEGAGVRWLARLRLGPAFRLLDTRRSTGRGSTVALQTQGGLSFWGPESLVGDSGKLANDGRRIGVMGQVALEGVRWTSRSSGWCARLRGTIESLFLRLPDTSQPPPHPWQRWAAAVLLDLGRAW